DLVVGELADPLRLRDPHLAADLARLGVADAVDVGQRNHRALVGRDIDACDTRHARSPCPSPWGPLGPFVSCRPAGCSGHAAPYPAGFLQANKGQGALERHLARQESGKYTRGSPEVNAPGRILAARPARNTPAGCAIPARLRHAGWP